MSNIFLISDTHWGHDGVTQFLRDDGSKLRPWDNPDDMDEAMIENWNSVVGKNDRVYHLGDVVINRRCLKTLARLNGKSVLIKGNHDIFRLNEYAEYFDDIRGTHKLDKFILSHIPIHRESIARWVGGNIHGHLHSNRVMLGDKIDPMYYCVSVEHINYTPIAYEDLKLKVNKQQEESLDT